MYQERQHPLLRRFLLTGRTQSAEAVQRLKDLRADLLKEAKFLFQRDHLQRSSSRAHIRIAAVEMLLEDLDEDTYSSRILEFIHSQRIRTETLDSFASDGKGDTTKVDDEVEQAWKVTKVSWNSTRCDYP